jgi:hypothetical protein
VIEYRELSTEQLLALMTVNIGPIWKCSDRRWRSARRGFPADGIDDDDVYFLCREGLIELSGSVAIATDSGRLLLQTGEWLRPFVAVTARSGTQSAHLSLQ